VFGFKAWRCLVPRFGQGSRGSVRVFASADEEREVEPDRIGDDRGIALGWRMNFRHEMPSV
jgi:hypothetical protein